MSRRRRSSSNVGPNGPGMDRSPIVGRRAQQLAARRAERRARIERPIRVAVAAVTAAFHTHDQSSASDRRADRLMRRRARVHRQTRRVVGLVCAVLLMFGGFAAVWAYFSSTGSGAGAASVGSITAPGAPTLSTSTSTVHVSWTAPSGTPVFGYYVLRDGGAASAGCGSAAAPITAQNCDDLNVPDGGHDYTVTAVLASWHATSGSSHIVVQSDGVAPDGPTLISPQTSGANSGTFSNGVFNASTWGTGCTAPATICGTAADNAGGSGVKKTQLQIAGTDGTNNGKYWDGGAWASGPLFLDAVGTSSWSYALPLPDDGTYSLVARTFDNAGNQSLDTSESITVDNSSATVAAPDVAASTTFGAGPVYVNNEPVTLSDGASDAAGSGVRSVAYYYCPGSLGTCSGGTGIGTSTTSVGSWPVIWAPLPADGPYRVVAVATDNAGNVSGPSDPTSVSVDTTPPNVSRPIVNGNS